MAAPPDPSKHHYIPEFLLRAWCGPDRRVDRFDRPIPSKIMVRRVFPSEAGWLRDLYASDGHQRGRQWLETQVFQIIDSRAAPVLAKFNSGPLPDLSPEERSAWTVFMRSLLLRTPEYLRGTLAAGLSILDEALDESSEHYARLRRESDPATFEEYKAGITLEERRRWVQNTLPDLLVNPRLGQFLNNLPTRLIVLPDDVPDFLLSDDPIIRTDGIMTEGGHIAMPISPRRLFLSAWRTHLLDEITSLPPKELVTNVNRWVVESARHFVVATDRSQERFIRNRFGRDPKKPLMSEP